MLNGVVSHAEVAHGQKHTYGCANDIYLTLSPISMQLHFSDFVDIRMVYAGANLPVAFRRKLLCHVFYILEQHINLESLSSHK